jgi:ATP synthase F1 complex assembly factor 2
MECKSIILAISYLCRNISYKDITAASRLEEEFQVEIWGVVEGGHDMDRLNNSVNLGAVGTFISLYWDIDRLEKQMVKWEANRD